MKSTAETICEGMVVLFLNPLEANQCFDSLNRVLLREETHKDLDILGDLQCKILGQMEQKNLRGVYREVAVPDGGKD